MSEHRCAHCPSPPHSSPPAHLRQSGTRATPRRDQCDRCVRPRCRCPGNRASRRCPADWRPPPARSGRSPRAGWPAARRSTGDRQSHHRSKRLTDERKQWDQPPGSSHRGCSRSWDVPFHKAMQILDQFVSHRFYLNKAQKPYHLLIPRCEALPHAQKPKLKPIKTATSASLEFNQNLNWQIKQPQTRHIN
ncbi:hypothetical protein EMIT0P100_120078 [Pseudomonas sp. IT-P100]